MNRKLIDNHFANSLVIVKVKMPNTGWLQTLKHEDLLCSLSHVTVNSITFGFELMAK